MTTRLLPIIGLLAFYPATGTAVAADANVRFPDSRPAGGSFSRPAPDETINVSPPGFSWWRAAPAGQVEYRLRVLDSRGASAYVSQPSDDPVCVPDQAFPTGQYSWTVEALDRDGSILDTTAVKQFRVAANAIPQPWIPASELLRRVPDGHPRLLFPKQELSVIRETLKTTRREAFKSLRQTAEGGLKMKPPPEPDYDQIKDPAERRLAYSASFQHLRRYHLGAMQHTALMYLMSGERRYGEAAKALLLDATTWDPEGISSVMAPYGDEVGLGLVKSEALVYDWIHDLLSEQERSAVEAMLVARAEQMLRRLQRRDFLARPESSHDGRLPGYLLEHAIVLSANPRAAVWMDYALKTILTVFPHWAGQDGGWAEGISYGLAYNSIFVTPLESLRIATGVDVWQRSFYGKLPYFFLFNVSPRGEIAGFGDSYDGSVMRKANSIRTLIQFHAERTGDRTLRWWVDFLRKQDGEEPSLSPIIGLIHPQKVQPLPPTDLPSDAVFRGVGWASLHSNLAAPDEDLLVSFKSSPFGGVSHSYADQNGFAILKGGLSLVRPGGSRYPQHGTPFHTQYTQQTLAQNSILVNGEGQTNRDASANGKIIAFESQPNIGYVCGDAQAAYGRRLTRFHRHVILVRPSLVCVIDDLESQNPSRFQWLIHTPEKLALNPKGQSLVSRRGDAEVEINLLSPGGFDFKQTDQWPLAPKTGFPTAKKSEPQKLWHFTAATRQRAASRQIAAVMHVGTPANHPQYSIDQSEGGHVLVKTKMDGKQVLIEIDLTKHKRDRPLVDVQFRDAEGVVETLTIP